MKLSPKVVAPVLVLAGSLAVAAVMVSNRPSAESNQPERVPPLVQVLRAQPQDALLRVPAQGTVEPRTEIDLVTEVAGRIVWVSPNLASGGFFREGEPLLRIDERDYQVALEGARAALSRAESNLTHARATLERQRSMRQTGASSRARLDDAIHAEASADAGVREARVAVQRAELDLERTRVVAPFAGRVREKWVDVGQFVGQGMPAARIYSVDYAEVRLPISDADLAYLELPVGGRPGPIGGSESSEQESLARPIDSLPSIEQTPRGPAVQLSAEYAGKRHVWHGYVVRTEGALDARSRMLTVVARVDDPYALGEASDRSPLPVGLFVDASIEGRTLSQVFALPRGAVRHKSEVLVVDGEGRLRVRPVQVLRTEEERTLIGAGLSAGERVVVSPLGVVTEGMAVRTTEVGIGRGAASRRPEASPIGSAPRSRAS